MGRPSGPGNAVGPDGDRSHDQERGVYTWRPKTAVAEHLPPGYSLPMRCLASAAGARRFLSTRPTQDFLLQASLGGQAILHQAQSLGPEQSASYDAMRLIYQWAPLQREFLARRFKNAQDLRVREAVRGAVGGADLLPDDLGQDGSGAGRRWTVTELMKQGRTQARLVDGQEPDPERCIAAGLYLAAGRNPIDSRDVSPEQARSLVFQGLFDLGPAPDPVDPTTRHEVADRLATWLGKHLQDDTATFDRKFYRGRENVILAIAKQKKGPGPIARELVRQALLDLVFQSYRYLGDCIHLQMRDFARALPVPLDPAEQSCFGAIYERQADLGGLPLILLRDRFSFLKDAVLAILEHPDNRHHLGVLLRMLGYYGVMVAQRRRADREAQRLRLRLGARAGRGTGPGGVTDPDGVTAPDPSPSDRSPRSSANFTALVISVCADRGIRCPCGDSERWTARWLDESSTNEILKLEVECARCGWVSDIVEIPRPEFAALARRSRDDGDG
jgi:hypothetical protein